MPKKTPIVVIDGIDGRYCGLCEAWHPLIDFYLHKNGKDLHYVCKTAKIAKSIKERRVKRAASTEYRSHLARYASKRRTTFLTEDPKRLKVFEMLSNAKRRAIKRGLEFSITDSDLGDWRKITNCPVFPWIVLNWVRTKQSADSPTIDRIDCQFGYIPENVRITSWRANDLKKDASLPELRALLNDAKWSNHDAVAA